MELKRFCPAITPNSNGGNVFLSANTIELNDGNFEREIPKHKLLVVDCWAEWCGPCKVVGPIVEQLAVELKDRVTFGKLNVDENPITSQKYEVMSIPTFLVFKNGKQAGQFVGAMPKTMFQEKVLSYAK